MKVVEYNARFGDPETQVVLPMLKTDILDIFEAVTDERLSELKIEWEEGACVCVVLASGGYPEKYEKGKQIEIGALDERHSARPCGHETRKRRFKNQRRPRSGRVRQGKHCGRGARKGIPQRGKDFTSRACTTAGISA